MGIKSLYKYIYTNNLEYDIKIDKLKNSVVAIDISILLYQVVISTRSRCGVDHLSPTGEISSHILGLFNKTINLLQKKIIPVYVFDGVPPDIKKKTLDIRKEIRKRARDKLKLNNNNEDRIKYLKRSVSITKKQLEDCRELLNIMGIPYIDAPQEADSQCAYLARVGIVDGVLTEDMDILTFGSPIIYKNLYSSKKKPKIIYLKEVLSKTNLNFDDFIKWCCLLGSDYAKGIIDMNYQQILDNFKNYNEILPMINYCKNNNIRCCEYEEYEKVYYYFNNPEIREVKNKDCIIEQCNVKLLERFMVKKFGFNKSKLMKKFDYLKSRNKYLLKNNIY